MKYAIVSKIDEKSHVVSDKIRKTLQGAGWIEDEATAELIICVGGDGTLLYGVHQFIDRINDLKFIGIHTGTLGFFTDYTESELDECLHDMLNKEPHIYESGLLRMDLDDREEPLYALNEMRIENVIKSQSVDVYIDDEFFETCRGSGICLSTQAGSTAYNRGLGGAVIDCGLSVMQLAEITAIQHSKHRSLGSPYIMMENRIVKLRADTFDTAVLCYDHLNTPLKNTKTIICQMTDKKVKFARYRQYSYLKRLKNLY